MRKEQFKNFQKEKFPLQVVFTDLKGNVPLHIHDFFELVIMQKGSATHCFHTKNNEKILWTLMQGDCFLILPREAHSFESSRNAYYCNVIFSKEILRNELKMLSVLPAWNALFERADNNFLKIRLNLQERSYVEECLKRLVHELVFKPLSWELGAKNQFLNILMMILRKNPLSAELGVHGISPSRLLTVIENMEMHPEHKFTLAQLAKESGMCISGFTSHFRKVTGLSPMEYLVSLRTNKAVGLLLSTDESLIQIAEESGFYDTNYMIKIFKKYFGMTPGKFRLSNNGNLY